MSHSLRIDARIKCCESFVQLNQLLEDPCLKPYHKRYKGRRILFGGCFCLLRDKILNCFYKLDFHESSHLQIRAFRKICHLDNLSENYHSQRLKILSRISSSKLQPKEDTTVLNQPKLMDENRHTQKDRYLSSILKHSFSSSDEELPTLQLSSRAIVDVLNELNEQDLADLLSAFEAIPKSESAFMKNLISSSSHSIRKIDAERIEHLGEKLVDKLETILHYTPHWQEVLKEAFYHVDPKRFKILAYSLSIHPYICQLVMNTLADERIYHELFQLSLFIDPVLIKSAFSKYGQTEACYRYLSAHLDFENPIIRNALMLLKISRPELEKFEESVLTKLKYFSVLDPQNDKELAVLIFRVALEMEPILILIFECKITSFLKGLKWPKEGDLIDFCNISHRLQMLLIHQEVSRRRRILKADEEQRVKLQKEDKIVAEVQKRDQLKASRIPELIKIWHMSERK